MRRPLLAGNWKMNLGVRDALRLAQELRAGMGSLEDRDVAVFPTFVSVVAVAQAFDGTRIHVGGQNCYPEDDGAFTGEISASILRSTGATMVLLGHSERRHILGETDQVVRAKMAKALQHGLTPVLCVGETRPERETSQTHSVVERQVREGLRGFAKDQLGSIVLAYEPVWAIGTGLVATPDQAQEVHAQIRGILRELVGPASQDLRILYGGSVKGSNIAGLMAQGDIDGALVGGASLSADEFLRIVRFDRKST